ncbi:MAG: DUF1893 domain-containing protein [bacterium]|nr:DUF1893 domain-containing protein [bacterium]
MYTLQEFLDSDLSLVIYVADKEEFRSRASDLEPLVKFLDDSTPSNERPVVFDRYVGRAAALLVSTLKPEKVHTGVISEAGAQVLDDARIPYEAREQARYLMGVASEDMCRWEKLSMGKSPEELLSELRKTRER